MAAEQEAKTDKADDLLTQAQAAFERCKEHESKNRLEALDDIKFARLGEQWPEKVRKDRELDGRPCLTINRMPAFIRQVVNDARQNKPAISVHPADDGADPETAEIFTGLIRNIEQSSDAEIAYDTGLDCACSGGFGYFYIDLVYSDDETFDQDLVIRPFANPFAVYGDPDSSAFDSSDWNVAFVIDRLSDEAFEERYPDAEPKSFTDVAEVTKATTDGGVTIAAWWTRESVKRQIVLVSAPDLASPQQAQRAAAELFTGKAQIVDLDVFKANEAIFAAAGMTIVGKPRTVEAKKVTQRILNGEGVIETIEWAGRFIPIVPVYGEVVNAEGERHFRSLIRDAKDSARMHNYWRTTSTELVALAPKAPFIGRKGAFETDATKWATANVQTHAYIEYDGQEAPQRQPFAGVPAGAIQEALNASDDMKAILGLYDASLGARSNETSGKAIMARQREGDVSTFHYIDNLSRAIRHAGRILIDLIPKVYSVPRVVRILGPDGDAKLVPVNQKFKAPQKGKPGDQAASMPAGVQEQGDDAQIAQIEKIYDLRVGKYDLTVTAGPSFTSRREEAATQMMALIQAFPPAAPVIGDLLAKNLDWPGADEIAERLKAMIPQAGGDPAANAQMEQAKTIIGQLQESLKKVEGEGQAAIAELQSKLKAAADGHVEKMAEIALDARRVDIEAENAETNRIKALNTKETPLDPEALSLLVTQAVQMALASPDLLKGDANTWGAKLAASIGKVEPAPAADADDLPPSAADAVAEPEPDQDDTLPPSAAEAA